MTERLPFHFSLSCIGEGNGNPLQCSCLENPRDGGAWWAYVYGVAQSWTGLKRLSSSSSSSRDHLYLGSCLFLQSRLFLNCVLMVLLLYSSKKTLSFSFKVIVRLHILWIGPLNAITAIILLWMEIGISSLAGMALLIIFMLLQSFSGKLFSSLR